MTGLYVLPAVAAGDWAESIRLISRRCTCQWAGPHLKTPAARWRRTDPRCPVRHACARPQKDAA